MGIPIRVSSNYNSTSTLLNSLPQGKSGGAMENLTNTLLGNNSAISLTDYASIKNGSYKKLLKAYYADSSAKDAEADAREAIKSKDASALYSTEDQSASKMTTSARSLLSASEALSASGDASLFKQKNEEGSASDMSSYDADKLVGGIKDFAKSYNSVLSASATSTDTKLRKSVSDMQSLTKANADGLSRAGISIGKDGQLSVDEDKLKSADVTKLKSLFNGAGSYGAQTAAYASQVNYYSTLNDSGSGSSYDANGSYSNAGGLLNSMYSAYL